jgi:hypothetical protein
LTVTGKASVCATGGHGPRVAAQQCSTCAAWRLLGQAACPTLTCAGNTQLLVCGFFNPAGVTVGQCAKGHDLPADLCGYYAGAACPNTHNNDEPCGAFAAGAACSQPADTNPILCENLYAHGGPCVCAAPTPELCAKPMRRLGTSLTPMRAPIDVASTRDPDYLAAPGAVLVFPVRAMPDAGVVV